MSEPVPIVSVSEKVVNIEKQQKNAPARQFPKDLFVPADALEIVTQDFEGPLDLLLYLINKNKFDVVNIPVAEIAQQYANFISLMQKIQFELAGEYLAMAATLAHIKSRMLLPPKQRESIEEEEIDPRQELAYRLQEYERIRATAVLLEKRSRLGRDIFLAQAKSVRAKPKPVYKKIELTDLIEAYMQTMQRFDVSTPMLLQTSTYSTKDRVKVIVEHLRSDGPLRFSDLVNLEESKASIVVTFLALLELINANKITAVQLSQNSQIHIQLDE